MQFYFFLFALLYIAFYCLLLALFRVPSKRSADNLRLQISEKSKPSERLFNAIVKPFIVPVSKLIRLEPAREAYMAQALRRCGVGLTPKEYYARAIVCAVFSLPLSALMYLLGAPHLVPITLLLSIVIFFHFIRAHLDRLKEKKDNVELALPGFIRSILYKIDQSGKEGAHVQIDLIKVFEDYLKVANDVFYYDVAMLITEMKSMDIQTALRNFNNRLGLPEVSFLVGALIGIERGEQQRDALFFFFLDMNLKAKENIRKVLAKRPGKVKLATIPLVVVAVFTLLYVIVSHLFMSIGGLI